MNFFILIRIISAFVYSFIGKNMCAYIFHHSKTSDSLYD